VLLTFLYLSLLDFNYHIINSIDLSAGIKTQKSKLLTLIILSETVILE